MRFLQITNIVTQEISDKSNKIYLGSWCLKNSLGESDKLIMKDKWDNKAFAYKNYKYLHDLKKRLLPCISLELNKLHNIKLSNRSWDIILGYWLIQFLTMFLNRWQNIENLKKIESDLYTILPRFNKVDLIASDSKEAGELYYSDEWNFIFYAYLIKYKTKIKYELRNFKLIFKSKKSKKKYDIKKIFFSSFKTFIKKFLFFFIEILKFKINSQTIVLSSHSLSTFRLFYLIFTTKYKIKIEENFKEYDNFIVNKNLRNWKINKFIPTDDFEESIINNINLFMPASFLENFKKINDDLNNSNINYLPALIFSCNNHLYNDAFKIWAASKSEKNCKIMIGQHGGGAFQKYNTGIQYEIDISDSFITTGTGNRLNEKIRHVGQFWARLKNGKFNKNGYALLNMTSMPKYISELRSMALANQMSVYFNDQLKFFSNLKEEIKSQTLIRIYPKGDFGWNQEKIWLNNFPNVKLDYGERALKKVAENCRIFIGTNNTTTYHESLAANVPTIVFWDPNLWEIDPSVKNDLASLKSVKILHSNPKSAAFHLNNIWNNIDEWWSRRDVQMVRADFCDKYAYTGNRLIKNLSDAILETIECDNR